MNYCVDIHMITYIERSINQPLHLTWNLTTKSKLPAMYGTSLGNQFYMTCVGVETELAVNGGCQMLFTPQQ